MRKKGDSFSNWFRRWVEKDSRRLKSKMVASSTNKLNLEIQRWSDYSTSRKQKRWLPRWGESVKIQIIYLTPSLRSQECLIIELSDVKKGVRRATETAWSSLEGETYHSMISWRKWSASPRSWSSWPSKRRCVWNSVNLQRASRFCSTSRR